MTAYVKSFLVLFVLLALLLYLPPGKRLSKYIRFFAGMILTMGLLSPVLSVLFDSETFLKMIRYEEFAEELSGISRDMERMEYMEKDYMAAQYERAIAEDVMQLAGQYGYETAGARVRLSESYEVAEIELWISETDVEDDRQTVGEIVIGEIVLGEGPGAGDTSGAAGGKNAGDTSGAAGGKNAGDTSGAAGGKNAGDTSGAGEHGELAREIASYYRVDPSVVRIH